MRKKKVNKVKSPIFPSFEPEIPATPRTQQLLDIVNSRDLSLIKGLHGFGTKKAQDLVDNLENPVASMAELRMLREWAGELWRGAYDGLLA